MKEFSKISFSHQECGRQLASFRDLLGAADSLAERRDLKPFFEQSPQLAAFIGTYVFDIGPANLLAHPFEIAGDFAADMVVGNQETQTFCMVEFEDAAPGGAFVEAARHATEWSRRFEHGFSQLVDWFYALDDLKGTANFARNFGYGHTKFHGLLVVGISAGLSDSDRRRLRWRAERVLVNSHPIHCVTYDELLETLQQRLSRYAVAERPHDPAP